ncbi:TetR family transcriptional regulator [Streptomyces sp. Amel2xB2]|uniref:TetR/AcrR family transcriptional regulator n=1 Tax=Streptomyces sp. Amel2xB2 TaxID=1305829 RepID=UPI000DBA90E0|nr:TetR/AcrR family transcriptional regulator [Streptomyces sp. Amel2xB2]RAJ71454.1 TetR family transcriptional regulator [Streptomyces sp. Amel2xB2]
MPTARETLLEAAHRAVGTQPWAAVRMVDVATAAGVSRQTLYNEFGTKEGLGAALVHRLVDGFVEGAARAAAEGGRGGSDPAGSCAAAAAWMLRTARDEPIVRAALTGCWGSRMPTPPAPAPVPVSAPAPVPVSAPSASPFPAAAPSPVGAAGSGVRSAVAVRPVEPGPLAATLCERMMDGLPRNGSSGRLGLACETGVRLALSFVVAPPGADRSEEEAVRQIRDVVRALLSQHR